MLHGAGEFAATSACSTDQCSDLFSLREESPFLFREDAPIAAGDERRHVGSDAGQAESSWIYQVPRLPHGIELLFERAQALEIVETGAVLVEEVAGARMQGRKRGRLEARHRRHTEVERRVAVCFSPDEHVHDERFHYASRCELVIAHEIDRELTAICPRPQIRERDDSSTELHDRDRESREVL